MKLTKLEHSGLAIEKDGKVLLFDPVEFTEKLPEFSGVVAIVITHKHDDHCQPEKIAQILAKNPGAKIITTEDNIENLSAALKATVAVAHPGDTLQIGSFDLRFFGGEHAAIAPGQTPCQNLGVEVNDKLINPGDSFDTTGLATTGKVLLVPIAAPWCKISEVADFVRAAKPSVVIPVHDAVLSPLGLGYSAAHLSSVCQQLGAEFRALKPGESILL